jgi:hypothetical protein
MLGEEALASPGAGAPAALMLGEKAPEARRFPSLDHRSGRGMGKFTGARRRRDRAEIPHSVFRGVFDGTRQKNGRSPATAASRVNYCGQPVF